MTIALVGGTQKAGAQYGNSASARTVTLPAPTTAGNLIVVCVSFASSAARTVTVTDDKSGSSNTYTEVSNFPKKFAASFGYTDMWYVDPATSGAAQVITVTPSASVYMSISVAEFSGVASSPLDGAGVVANGSGVTPATGNITAAQNDSLYVAALDDGGSSGTITVNDGFSAIYSAKGTASLQTISATYKIDSGNNSPLQETWTITSTAWACGIACFKPAAGAGAYTLTAAAGSYAQTGNASGLLFGRNLAAAAGSYAITGSAANLLLGRKLAAAAGAYSLTGNDAILSYAGASTYTLTAANGTYALTGNAAGLLWNRVLSAAAGTYALTGRSAALTYSGTPAAVPDDFPEGPARIGYRNDDIIGGRVGFSTARRPPGRIG